MRRDLEVVSGEALDLPTAVDDLSLWRLLASNVLERVLLVGHSLGGALACLAATRLGVAAQSAAAQSAAAPALATPPDRRERR